MRPAGAGQLGPAATTAGRRPLAGAARGRRCPCHRSRSTSAPALVPQRPRATPAGRGRWPVPRTSNRRRPPSQRRPQARRMRAGRCPAGRPRSCCCRGQCRPRRLARRHRALSAADRVALCGDRLAGEPARPRLHERHNARGDPGRHPGAGGRGHRREHPQAAVEVPRLRFAVRNGSGDEIYSLDRDAGAQRARHRASAAVPLAARFAAARDAATCGAILQPARSASPECNEGNMARILIAEDEEFPAQPGGACAHAGRPRGR